MTAMTIQKASSTRNAEGQYNDTNGTDFLTVRPVKQVLGNQEYLPPKFENFPIELTNLANWLVWKQSKIPYRAKAPLCKASVTDPTTWSSFAIARLAYESGGVQGVSFVLDGNGIGGIDIDNCVVDGKPSSVALQILDGLSASYIEFSPSGKGLRAFGYMQNLMSGRRGVLKGLSIEIYTSKRHLSVTGHIIKGEPLTKFHNIDRVLNEIGRPTEVTEATDVTEETECNSSVSSVPSVGLFIDFPSSVLPFTVGQRNKKIFELARWTRGEYAEASESFQKNIFDAWWQKSLHIVGTKDKGVSWADFKNAMLSVKQPYGDVLKAAYAASFEFIVPDGVHAYGDNAVRLMKLCMALQQRAGEAPFFLACRAAAKVLKFHFTDVSSLLRVFVADGLLILITQGTGANASRYKISW